MLLGIVRGEIVSTINHPFLDGKRMLVCDRIDEFGEPTGGYLIAIAAVEAGVGERVLILDEGNGARQVLGDANAPVRSVVVGVIDAVEVEA